MYRIVNTPVDAGALGEISVLPEFYGSYGAPPEPRSLGERTDRILEMMANPSELGGMPSPAQEYEAHIRRLKQADPPARSLGYEMVLLAAGPIGRGLPFAVRAGKAGIASARGLTIEAERALEVYARSMMSRMGRMPTAAEMLEAIKPLRHVADALGTLNKLPADDRSDSIGATDRHGGSNITPRWELDASGQAVVRPSEVETSYDRSLADAMSDLDRFFQWVVTEAQEKLGEANDRWRSKPGRSFQSYTKDRIDSNRVYAGRTSGYRSPRENVAERDRRDYPSEEYFEAELDKSSGRYSSIRGREQQLIDYYRSLNRSDNADNGIWPGNRLRSYYLRNADAEFGPLLPQTRKSR